MLISGGAHGNTLNGNFIGTTAKGDAAIGNSGNGVWLDRAPGNSLIGCRFVNNPFVYYNVVSGNGRNGLRVTDSADDTVQGNFFGDGADNTAIVPNRADGIRVDGTSANTQVGGVIPLGNVSAGNRRNGIELTGRVRGFVTFNTFGGLQAFKGAAPNGNDGYGVVITGHAHRNVVFRSDIGTGSTGISALGNRRGGVLISGHASRNAVGFPHLHPANLISGNTGNGVTISGRACRNVVFRNFIGLNRFARALPSSGQGLVDNGCRNVIFGNRFHPR